MNLQVIWTRGKKIITVNMILLTHNPRISLRRNSPEEWHLEVKNIQADDAGEYVCKVFDDITDSVEERTVTLRVLGR